MSTGARIHGKKSTFSIGQLAAIRTKHREAGDSQRGAALDRRPIAVEQIRDAPNGCSLVKIYTNGARLQRRPNRQRRSGPVGLMLLRPPSSSPPRRPSRRREIQFGRGGRRARYATCKRSVVVGGGVG
uniref:Uncharacterized protein n=1 Tax=Plectus sambesii TaxID=2011161 RepID=A0A914V5R7_9BILA